MSTFPSRHFIQASSCSTDADNLTPCERLRSSDASCTTCRCRCLTICRALTAEQLVELERIATVIRLDPGRTLFDQGDAADFVYNVTAGTVRLSMTLSDGRRQITGFMLPGDFIGLSSRAVHSYSAEAVSPSQLCRFNAPALRQMAERVPGLEHELFARVRDELDAAHDQMLLLGRKSPREKIATFLLDLAGRRQRWGERPDRVHLDMTRGDIGDYLGLTLETVSRTLNRMKRDGVIALPSAAEVVFLKTEVIEGLAQSQVPARPG